MSETGADENRKAGRPTKFQDAFVEQARKLAALGATDREVAEFFDVTERTLNRWKHEHEGFCQSLKIGKETADQRVEQALYRRALGYMQDDTHFSSYEGNVTQTAYVKQVPPDTTAAIFWLKNRKPTEWREKMDIEHGLTNALAERLLAARGRVGSGA